jgi:hypothetical protein
MNILQQVCNIEQAKRLKELGVMQVSIACFIGEELHLFNHRLYNWAEQKNINAVAAFTVAELGILLPATPKINWATFFIEENIRFCHVNLNGEPWGAYPNESQARAALLIYLLENQVIDVSEVNTRIATL